MSASLIKMGPVSIFDESGDKHRFKPEGKLYKIGDTSSWHTDSFRENPIKRASKEATQGGRLLVGFNVGIEEKWKMQDIVDIVFAERRSQVKSAIKDGDAQPHPLGGDVGVSFMAQSGIWQSMNDDKAYPENGAQIMIMNNIAEKKLRFRDDMVRLAEVLATKLNQTAVIVEMSRSGSVIETIEVEQ